MRKSRQATFIVLAILAFVGVAAAGLHHFAETGQMAPASATNGATKSDQRDATVSNDVANHKIGAPKPDDAKPKAQ
ncbi:MAG: hypothetical protein JO048_06655 [Methylobacteriaceae bacterium]|nr:hypothetical protein [Methylobacteriaceae bacterium]